MPTYKRLKSKNGASRKKRTQKKYRKAKSRKIMRGGDPVSWIEYNKRRFGDSSVSSHAREIGHKIFDENAKLEDTVIPALASANKLKTGLSDTDYDKYFRSL